MLEVNIFLSEMPRVSNRLYEVQLDLSSGVETVEFGFPDADSRELWMGLFVQATAHTQAHSDGKVTIIPAVKAAQTEVKVEYPKRPAAAKAFEEVSLDPSLHLSDEIKKVCSYRNISSYLISSYVFRVHRFNIIFADRHHLRRGVGPKRGGPAGCRQLNQPAHSPCPAVLDNQGPDSMGRGRPDARGGDNQQGPIFHVGPRK